MNLQDLNSSDLEAIANGNMSKVSDNALNAIASGGIGNVAPSQLKDSVADTPQSSHPFDFLNPKYNAQQESNGPANFVRGMALQPPTDQSMVNRAFNYAGNVGVPQAVGALGMMFGGPLGAGAGASLARAGQHAASTAMTGQSESPVGIGLDVAGTGLLQGAVEGYKPQIQAGLGAIGSKIGSVASGIDKYLTTNLGGVSKQVYDFTKDNLAKVASHIHSTPGDADNIANNIRTSISNAETALEAKYKEGAIKLSQEAVAKSPRSTPFRLDLESQLGDVARNIAKDAGYMEPNVNAAVNDQLLGVSGQAASTVLRNQNTPQAQAFKSTVIDRIQNMKDASPYDVYLFQKDLNAAIDDNIVSNPSLAKNLLQAKDAVRLFIEDHPRLKPIADLNAAWTSAKNIATDAKKLVSSNDLISYVQKTLGSERDTLAKRPLQSLSMNLPEVGEQLKDAQAYVAGQQFAPPITGLSKTGYTPGMIGLAGTGALYANKENIKEHPYMSAGAGILALGLSPRAGLYRMQAGQFVADNSPTLMNFTTEAGRAVAQGSLTNYFLPPPEKK